MPFDGTPITDPAIELLEKVRNLLEEKKWVKGSFVQYHYDDNNVRQEAGYCIAGAINHFHPTVNDYFKAIDYLGFRDQEDIYGWNDADHRTKAGVLRRLTLRINKAKQSLLLKV